MPLLLFVCLWWRTTKSYQVCLCLCMCVWCVCLCLHYIPWICSGNFSNKVDLGRAAAVQVAGTNPATSVLQDCTVTEICMNRWIQPAGEEKIKSMRFLPCCDFSQPLCHSPFNVFWGITAFMNTIWQSARNGDVLTQIKGGPSYAVKAELQGCPPRDLAGKWTLVLPSLQAVHTL